MVVASISGSLVAAIGNHGLYAVFGLMALDAVFPALSELVMLFAGAVASGAIAGDHVVLFGSRIGSHAWAFVAMALAGTVGYTLGSVFGWAIGYAAGRPFLERHGRWVHLSPPRLAQAERWFDRWDDAAVFVGRLTPVVRSFVSIPAGVLRMPLGRFTVLTFLGCAIWCFAFAGAGWGLGASYTHLHREFRYVDYAVLALIVAFAVYLVVRWRRSSRLGGGARAEDPLG